MDTYCLLKNDDHINISLYSVALWCQYNRCLDIDHLKFLYKNTIGHLEKNSFSVYLLKYFPRAFKRIFHQNVKMFASARSHDEMYNICNISIKYKQNNPSKTNEDIQGVYIEFQFKGSGGWSPMGRFGLGWKAKIVG